MDNNSFSDFDKIPSKQGNAGLPLSSEPAESPESAESVELPDLAELREQFNQILDQFSHDVRAPLATLMMVVRICREIPERERILLRSAVNGIADLLKDLNPAQDCSAVPGSNSAAPTREFNLLAPFALSLLNEKKIEYQYTGIRFSHQFSASARFAWIRVDPLALRRAMSNIINNAVDAIDHLDGHIVLHLDADDHEVYLTIEDNGSGMPDEMLQWINTQTPMSVCRAQHPGLGLTQVREMLHSNYAEWSIDSQTGLGTNFTLIFPRSVGLAWLADTIRLGSKDTLVVLDDDPATHTVWDFRFNALKSQWPNLTLQHFVSGEQTIQWINNLDPERRKNLFLLADYELMGERLNGLDVIEASRMQRALLVTSHHADPDLQRAAMRASVRILPKELAPDLPIEVTEGLPPLPLPVARVVQIGDCQIWFDAGPRFPGGVGVATYQAAQDFLDCLGQYPSDTTILFAADYDDGQYQSLEIAQRLHEMGYGRLYLVMKTELPAPDNAPPLASLPVSPPVSPLMPPLVPPFLTVIHRGNWANLLKAILES